MKNERRKSAAAMRRARRRLKLTQEQVSQAAAVGRAYYCNLESGRYAPSPEPAQRLETILHLVPGTIATGGQPRGKQAHPRKPLVNVEQRPQVSQKLLLLVPIFVVAEVSGDEQRH